MKISILLLAIFIIAASCGGGSHQSENPLNKNVNKAEENLSTYDPQRGVGKFKDIVVPDTIDEQLVKEGNKVYTVKCSACHKTTEEKLVGPGWLGVTKRHKPEWILNFATNPEAMIDKDPALQAQLEICLVRMPNQNINDEEAKAVYEFMRKNDLKQK